MELYSKMELGLGGGKNYMITIVNKLMNSILRGRIKAFVITEFAFLLFYWFVSIYAIKDHTTNYLYIGQIIFAFASILMGIEHLLLKKKASSTFWFLISLFWIYLAYQNFHLFNMKL